MINNSYMYLVFIVITFKACIAEKSYGRIHIIQQEYSNLPVLSAIQMPWYNMHLAMLFTVP